MERTGVTLRLARFSSGNHQAGSITFMAMLGLSSRIIRKIFS
jgi:hypothetical protein